MSKCHKQITHFCSHFWLESCASSHSPPPNPVPALWCCGVPGPYIITPCFCDIVSKFLWCLQLFCTQRQFKKTCITERYGSYHLYITLELHFKIILTSIPFHPHLAESLVQCPFPLLRCQIAQCHYSYISLVICLCKMSPYVRIEL